MLCLQCVHEITRCYTFKQLCEQSDVSLRQYFGKPPRGKHCKEEDQNDFTTSLLLDNFGEDSTSDDSDEDDCKDDFSLLQNISENPNDEKAIAQKQLLKVAKSHKIRLSKRKLLSKGGKAAGKHKFWFLQS